MASERVEEDEERSTKAAWTAIPQWLQARLTAPPLSFRSMLPVQQKVVPFLTRAISSGLALDACISAPTGSGKTLCYLLPMLAMIAERKAVIQSTQLQAIILVPTKALALQVQHVLKSLTSSSSAAKKGSGDLELSQMPAPIHSVVLCGGNTPREESASLVRCVTTPLRDGEVSMSKTQDDDDDNKEEEFFFSLADVLIATPQRVLKHLGSTKGFSLKHLRMLVVDEADEILSGTFSNFAGTIVHYFEEEQEQQRKLAQGRSGEITKQQENALAFVAPQQQQVLHKVLCSATMTTHLARVSEIRLRNCKVFSLDSMGSEIGENAVVEQSEGAIRARVSTQFHLPPNLKEHFLVVKEDQRHAVLLHLVRKILNTNVTSETPSAPDGAADNETAAATLAALGMPKVSNGILIFCATADTARVVGKFLSLAGVPALEFTALATEVERRKALISGVSGKRREVIVTTDALMRGVDMPGVKHVIMYDPPRSLQQYVHRAGRTARALQEGNSYVLLSKYGPSETLADGEVAKFKALDSLLKRTTPLVYAKDLQAATPELVEEANALLLRTQKMLKTVLRGKGGDRPKPTTTPAAIVPAVESEDSNKQRKRPRTE